MMQKIIFETDLTKSQQDILERVRAGDNIHMESRGDGSHYFQSSGSTTPLRDVDRLLEGGFIEPVNDGLFDGFAQTLVAKDG